MLIRYLTAACAFTLVIIGLLTLAFRTNAKRAPYVMQISPVNVALSSNGAVASASSAHVSGNYPVAAVNNGDRKAMNWGSGGGWNDNTHGDYSSDIVQINFPAFNFVSQINVFTLRDNFQDNQTPPTLTDTFSTCENTGYGITEFEVQYWNGSMWVTVPSGLVRDNNKVWRQFTFPEVWASGVRVQVHGAARFTSIAINYSRIVEIEAFGRTAGFNLAAAANGAVATASSQIGPNLPVSAVNDGDRTGFNWNRSAFASGWNDNTENQYSIDWVRIDFAGGQARRINEIDVYTLRDGYSTKTDDPTIFETFSTADNTGEGMTDYDVQYLTGGVWRTVPGGKVTNNNKVRRQFRFSPITTAAIRVAVHKGSNFTTWGNNWSRLVEIEAWENAATPDDVVWVEDALPAGAVPSGSFEGWNWTCFNPLQLSGAVAHTSEIVAGIHQHFFQSAIQTLTVNAGDTLVAHVYLDPVNPPTSVMLQWNDGTFEHRAYWGANQFPWGTDGTISRRNMGALPPTGQWVRLEVPASLVGLEGRTLNGMAFSLFNGRATWDHAGKYAGSAPVIPTISISDRTVNEGNSGTTSAVFTVTLSSPSTQDVSVNYATTHGTTNSFDLSPRNGTVTFSGQLGETSKQISIPVFGDTVFEPNESFFVNLSSPVNATIADGQGIGTILNDDAQPSLTISIEDATVFEGSCGGTPSAVFRVTLSEIASQDVTVNFVTSNGSALSSADYIAASGTVTIPTGQTSATITVNARSDTLVEGDENFFVNLSGPVNAVIADGQGQAIIKDDDATPPVSNPGSLGSWGPCEELETVPVHMSLLPNGRLLYWGRDKVVNPTGADDGSDVGGGCNTYTWDPITKAKSGVIRNGSTNLFCSSHSFLPDGRLMVAGGHFRDNNRPYQEAMGENHINIFNPSTNTWNPTPSTMPRGRWYPSSVTLGFGETAIFAGTYWTGTSVARNLQPDIYNLQNVVHQSPANKSIRSYPYVHLADDGRVFGLSGTNGWFFDPFTHEFTNLPSPPSVLDHFEGSSVLYNTEAGKVMVAGGRQGTDGDSLSQVDIFDMKSRTWDAPAAPMNLARQYHNLTLLPDGKVLATGGQTCPGVIPNAECPALTPEIWDPATKTWTRLGENPTRTPRIYHSVALLLRDGRVLVGGGGLPAAKGEKVVNTSTNTIFTCSGNPTTDPTLCRHVGHKDAEIFSPPYLFQSPRPTINRPANSPPLTVSLGETFTISISSSTPVSTVALMRLPSVTHGLNFDQRRVVLTPQTPSTTSLTLTMPTKGTICPPGYYMLFVIANGVPSVAEFIKVSTPPAFAFPLLETGAQVARNFDGRLQAFYRGSDDTIYYTAQTSTAGEWSFDHIRLGGSIASNPVAIANADGRLEVFARGTDNTIYHAWQVSPGSTTWSGWFPLGGSAVGDPAVARNSNGRLQLIYRGTDNVVYTAAQTSAGSTHGWPVVHTALGGSFTSDPSVVLNADGRVEVFIRGSDNALYHAWQNAAGSSSWSTWVSLGGFINSVKVGVARNTDGTLQVFYRGGDNALYFTRQSSSFPGGWTPSHTSLGGGLTSDPTVGINNDGRLEVFLRGTDNALYHNWQTAPSGSGWSGYALLGGGLASGAAPALNANGRLSATVRGLDNALYYNVQASPGSSSSWVGYVRLGGNASSF